jgi:hypothetical protein
MGLGVTVPKWKPPPGYTYDDAYFEAKKIDPAATIRFDDTAPPGQRFQVIWRTVIDNVRYGGMLGSGNDWPEALAEAKRRWDEHWAAQEAKAKAAAEKEETPTNAPETP